MGAAERHEQPPAEPAVYYVYCGIDLPSVHHGTGPEPERLACATLGSRAV